MAPAKKAKKAAPKAAPAAKKTIDKKAPAARQKAAAAEPESAEVPKGGVLVEVRKKDALIDARSGREGRTRKRRLPPEELPL